MKTILSILTLISLSSCSQSKTSGENDEVKIDTVNDLNSEYLARRDSIVEVTEFGSIYYSKDTASKIYDWLIPGIDDISQSYLGDYISHIKDNNNIELKHYEFQNLNKNWTSLFWFHNDYCLYSPSDWMANTGIILSDSIFYIARSDADLKLILEYKSISTNSHQFKLIDYNGIISFANVEVMNPDKGVSIWSHTDLKGNLVSKVLMVESEKVKKFPVLVFDCGDEKCVFDKEAEYFEEPDFISIKENQSK